jgi:hypothetical protein
MLFGQYPNVRVSAPVGGVPSYQPEEVSINPLNPLNIAAGATVRYWYASTDGGLSWTENLLPLGTSRRPEPRH